MEAAVDGDHRAGEVRRVGRAEEGNRGRELLVAADPPEVHPLVEHGLTLGRARRVRRVAEDHAVDADAACPDLLGERGNETGEPGLRRRVAGAGALAVLARDGRHAHDAAVAPLEHRGHHCPRAQER